MTSKDKRTHRNYESNNTHHNGTHHYQNHNHTSENINNHPNPTKNTNRTAAGHVNHQNGHHHNNQRPPLRIINPNHPMQLGLPMPQAGTVVQQKEKNPKEAVEDFNKALGVYAEDIHQCQKEDEDRQWRNRKWNCFTVQTEVTEQMRSILIDWLCEVTEEYNLTVNTLFLTANYVDRILEEYSIPRSKLQLLGVSCMLIACKFEEIHPPLVEDFVYITDNTYSREEIIRTELISLNTLKFSLTICTIKNFLTRFLLISEVRDYRILHQTNYLAELTLPDYTIHQKYKPSLIAAAITSISKFTFNLPAFTPVFEMYCGYTKAEILPCIHHIYGLHARITQAAVGDLTSAREKYKSQKYAGVSLIPLPLDIIRM